MLLVRFDDARESEKTEKRGNQFEGPRNWEDAPTTSSISCLGWHTEAAVDLQSLIITKLED